MDLGYVITPFFAWFVAGVVKFSINSIKAGKLAFSQIGYGGLPSNHSAIVCSVSALIMMREGWNHPALGVSLALSFIVMLDANSLRKQVGKQAVIINESNICPDREPLRERMGHSPLEIISGCVVGCLCAFAVNLVFL